MLSGWLSQPGQGEAVTSRWKAGFSPTYKTKEKATVPRVCTASLAPLASAR